MINIAIPKKHGFMKTLGYFFIVPGMVFVSVGIAGFFENSPTKNDQILGGLVFGGIAVFCGAMLVYSAVKKEKNALNRYAETVIYSLAKENKGTLNTIDTSIALQLSEEECEKMLQDFVIKGHAIPEVNEKGFVEYKFPVYLND